MKKERTPLFRYDQWEDGLDKRALVRMFEIINTEVPNNYCVKQ